MNRVILFALVALLAYALVPTASAAPECYGHDVAGVACIGDYAYTIGDDCEDDSIHEEGTGANVTTPAGYTQAGGYTYCNVFGGYDYYEEGVRARVDAGPLFLEVSWNSWSFVTPDGEFDDEGCSTWVYYVGPLYGYFNNVGCPAGPPPDMNWGHLLS